MNDEINDEQAMEDALIALLEDALYDGSLDFRARSVRAFSETGLMTRDKGLVLTLANGAEFQLTIRQSRFADEDPEPDEADESDEGEAED